MATPTATVPTTASERIVFIDVLRAYAILMMLQGHFVDTMLMPEYRDNSLPIYSWWSFFRGMTAPIFFFSTGLVFVYLLLRGRQSLRNNHRVVKGIRRGFFLIFIGYLLRFNLSTLISFKFYNNFFQVDVLHCIGLSLIALVLLYVLASYLRLPYHWLLLAAGLGVFLLDPVMKAQDWSFLPKVLENYFTKRNGSVFTPIPWMGFAFLGGVFGRLLTVRPQLNHAWWLPWLLMGCGALLHYQSTNMLKGLYALTGITNIQRMADNNWLFWEFGHVLIAVSVIILLTRIWRPMPRLVTKIGSETLTIYAVHYVVLYGSWFGIGFHRYYRQSFLPHEAALGAMAFLLAFVLLIYYIEPVREAIDRWLTRPLTWLWRFTLAMLWWAVPERMRLGYEEWRTKKQGRE